MRSVINRVAVFMFGMSVALFEAELLDQVSRARQKGRALFTRRRQERQGGAEPRGPQAASHKSAERTLPIVFIHQGDSQHLTYSLAQAKDSNPDATVVLIGDDSN